MSGIPVQSVTAPTVPEPSGGIEESIAAHLRGLAREEVRYVGRAPGNSHEGYVFELGGRRSAGRPASKVLVRLDPEIGPFLHYDGAAEALLMQQLAGAGFPVPAVLGNGDGAAFGAPYLIIEWVDGEVHNPRSVSSLPHEVRVAMAREMARVLSRLHATPPTSVGVLASASESGSGAGGFLAQFDDVLDQFVVLEAPVLEYTRIWLDRRLRATDAETAVVHGDFRLANLVWRDTTIASVLDWETARLGHPLFDVGWMCMSAHRGSDPVMGLVTRDEFVRLYEEESARHLDPRDVLLWQVAAGWVRGCTEVRLADLALQSDDFTKIDVRDLSWQFGAHRTDAELLRLMEEFERHE